MQTICKDEKVFITEVFAGCVRFDSLLKVFIYIIHVHVSSTIIYNNYFNSVINVTSA